MSLLNVQSICRITHIQSRRDRFIHPDAMNASLGSHFAWRSHTKNCPLWLIQKFSSWVKIFSNIMNALHTHTHRDECDTYSTEERREKGASKKAWLWWCRYMWNSTPSAISTCFALHLHGKVIGIIGERFFSLGDILWDMVTLLIYSN